ncbi:rhomboid-like protein [Gordonia sp. VNK1]|uniref:rhomboid-like protein n=1 Tax=Gordonia oleivorans TaxID=3156618 RepID=UPI0032B3AE7E
MSAWPRRVAGAAWRQVRGAPLTFGWLIILFVTTSIQHSLTPRELDDVLGDRSTNIANLTSDPLEAFHVLVASLFWIDGQWWFPYLILFLVFHRPAEQWLGSVRWFVVGFSAHVIATFLSEGALDRAIDDGLRSPSMVNVLDVGVSYFLAAIVGVLAYRIVRPWRWVYLAGVALVYGLPLAEQITFTGIGHASSVLIGLAWYPITRGRPGAQWDPVASLRRLRRGPTATAGPLRRYRADRPGTRRLDH